MLRIENEILRMIANGEPLDQTARQICAIVEGASSDLLCSILTVDRAGLLHPLAAPRLPERYTAALDGVLNGPEVGSCGAAAYRREPVFVDDIAQDSRFATLIHLLDGIALKSCWSFPVIEASGDTVAVLAMYSTRSRRPTSSERELAETCVDLCATALRRHERTVDRERRASIDALTGLPNRSAFQATMANIPCDAGSWGLFVLDLDRLRLRSRRRPGDNRGAASSTRRRDGRRDTASRGAGGRAWPERAGAATGQRALSLSPR